MPDLKYMAWLFFGLLMCSIIGRLALVRGKKMSGLPGIAVLLVAIVFTTGSVVFMALMHWEAFHAH